MKVVYVIDHLRGDGTQRFLTTLVKSLKPEIDEQVVVSLNDSYDAHVVSRLEQAGATVIFIGRRALLMGYGLIRFLWIIKRRSPDAVISFLFFSGMLGNSFGCLCSIPLVIGTLRSSNINLSHVHNFLLRLAYRLCSRVVVNSSSLKEIARDRYHIETARIAVIPNWVEIERTSLLSRDALFVEIGLEEGVFIFISVGRLDQYKGFDIIIEALSSLDSRLAHLLIIGKGPIAHRLRKAAEDRGVADRVHFLGYLPDAYRYIAACDCYIQASRFEGLSNATLEAVALGVPTIASRVEGSEELEVLTNKIEFFEKGNVEQLTKLMRARIEKKAAHGLETSALSCFPEAGRQQWLSVLEGRP